MCDFSYKFQQFTPNSLVFGSMQQATFLFWQEPTVAIKLSIRVFTENFQQTVKKKLLHIY